MMATVLGFRLGLAPVDTRVTGGASSFVSLTPRSASSVAGGGEPSGGAGTPHAMDGAGAAPRVTSGCRSDSPPLAHVAHSNSASSARAVAAAPADQPSDGAASTAAVVAAALHTQHGVPVPVVVPPMMSGRKRGRPKVYADGLDGHGTRSEPTGKTGVYRITYKSAVRVWRATVYWDRRVNFLGTFSSEEAAVQAHDRFLFQSVCGRPDLVADLNRHLIEPIPGLDASRPAWEQVAAMPAFRYLLTEESGGRTTSTVPLAAAAAAVAAAAAAAAAAATVTSSSATAAVPTGIAAPPSPLTALSQLADLAAAAAEVATLASDGECDSADDDSEGTRKQQRAPPRRRQQQPHASRAGPPGGSQRGTV